MQTQPNKNKNVVMALIIIGALVGAYLMFFKGGDVTDDALLSPEFAVGPEGMPIGTGAAVGGDLLPLLTELESLRLDDSIFSDPVFDSLVDYTIEISKQSVGRNNPFAPLGRVTSPQARPLPTINLPRR